MDIDRDDMTMIMINDLKDYVSGNGKIKQYRFRYDVKRPEVPVDFNNAHLIVTRPDNNRCCFGFFFPNPDPNNLDKEGIGMIVTTHGASKLEDRRYHNQVSFKKILINQRLFDFQEQWEYYRELLARQHTPEMLYDQGYIDFEEAETAWNIYDLYHKSEGV